jgi:hypothetical protein
MQLWGHFGAVVFCNSHKFLFFRFGEALSRGSRGNQITGYLWVFFGKTLDIDGANQAVSRYINL